MIKYPKINVLILLNIFLLNLYPQQNISVKQFPYIDQLPSNSVKRIYQDGNGYMWFGTLDGLCRFDGYRIITFRSNINNPGLLVNNEINSITEDTKKNLWIGTKEGINILNKNNYTISRLENEFIKGGEVYNLRVTRDSCIWIGINADVLCFNPDYTLRKRYGSDMTGTSTSQYIFEDQNGDIWLTKWDNGLWKYDKEADRFVSYPPVGARNNPFIVFQDKRGQYWICSWGDGIFLFYPDRPADQMYVPVHVYNKEKKTKESTFFSITQDDNLGYIWAVSFSGMYAFEYSEKGEIKEVQISDYFKNYNNIFSEITKDKSGNLWIGSFDEGIINIDFNKPVITNYDLSHIKQSTGHTPNITSIYEDTDGVIWFSQNRWGMGMYYPGDKKTMRMQSSLHKEFSSFISATGLKSLPGEVWIAPMDETMIYSLSRRSDSIVINYSINLSDIRLYPGEPIKIFEDRNNNIWVTTTSGLFIKPYRQELKPFLFSAGRINDIVEDQEGNIWFGTANNGFYKVIRREGGSFSDANIIQYSVGNSHLKSDNITALCADDAGRIWVGTQEGFIQALNTETNSFTETFNSLKMIGEGIFNIIKDNYGHIWILTNKRVIEYNPQNDALRDYSAMGEISINSFRQNAYCVSSDGRIMFGGNGGITVFTPTRELSEISKESDTHITDIRVNNQSVLTSEHRKINMVRNTLIFEPDDRNIEILFSSLNYSFAGRVQYAYKMEGVDREWVYTDYNRQFAFYNQLSKGNHTFLIKSTDENGLWSDQVTQLRIYKKPALYQTWWAYLLYVLLLASLIYYAYYRTKKQIRLRNELKIAQIEKSKSEELTQTKLRYFTNISHDFLTPLTILSCLVDDIETTTRGRLDQFDLMRSNINRLRRLLQQVLDFRKVESGNMKLKIAENDIARFIHDICYKHFMPLSKKKDIDLQFLSTSESIPAWFDADKIDKIIFNLLSNAFKYTPSGGSVEVNLREYTRQEQRFVQIKIKDSGIGISAEDQKNIFTRFYTNRMTDARETNGIGLSLTKELVDIHHGKILVESKIKSGTVFTIDIAIDKSSYSEPELAVMDSTQNNEHVIDLKSLDNPDEQPEMEQTDIRLLLVEDNTELSSLMYNILSKQFRVELAGNGLEALNILKEKEIDIIISDVMMPQMDGFEFCRTVKNDLETSHIPIILLTAKSTIDDRIECYKAGADGYISKPFELKLLRARINGFLSKRMEKRAEFKTNFNINISALENASIDEQFLEKTIKIIEEHLSESEFDVISLAENLNMSKSTLYRKMKVLTDLSPSDFIRNIRLKHACQMLKDTSITISEVAYSVGFSNPKYFSICFKNEFKTTPYLYQKNAGQNS